MEKFAQHCNSLAIEQCKLTKQQLENWKHEERTDSKEVKTKSRKGLDEEDGVKNAANKQKAADLDVEVQTECNETRMQTDATNADTEAVRCKCLDSSEEVVRNAHNADEYQEEAITLFKEQKKLTTKLTVLQMQNDLQKAENNLEVAMKRMREERELKCDIQMIQAQEHKAKEALREVLRSEVTTTIEELKEKSKSLHSKLNQLHGCQLKLAYQQQVLANGPANCLDETLELPGKCLHNALVIGFDMESEGLVSVLGRLFFRVSKA